MTLKSGHFVLNSNDYIIWCLVQLTLLLLVINTVEKTNKAKNLKDKNRGPHCIEIKHGSYMHEN